MMIMIALVATWMAGYSRHQPLATTSVCKKEQGQAKPKGNVKPHIAYCKALQRVYNIAFRTMYCSQTNTKSIVVEEAQQLGMGARKPGCKQTRQDDQDRHHPSF
jgi:hypothetical protein